MVDPLQLQTIRGPAPAPSVRPHAAPARTSHSGFAPIFQEALESPRRVTFSAHALERLASRNIELSHGDLERIANAIDGAAAKGSRESLLLMDRLALVVSVPNRIVITVLEPDSGENTVFTNIDSAVVVASDSENSERI